LNQLFVKPPLWIRKFFPSVLWRVKTNKKDVWLTFDDGPNPETTPFILDVLSKLKIKATFFLVGKNVEKHPNIIKEILSQGHVIGNHSYSHKNGWTTSQKEYISDVKKFNDIIPGIKIFRPPYGKINKRQIIALKDSYKIILWDVLSYDYKKEIMPNKVKNNVLDNIENGSIIVFHDNKKSMNNIKEILHETLYDIKNKGYNFSTSW
tara:strand:+ start:1151 stop:1771 length:621 start_codon:yes stop_codon:yes gene_type:complete